VRRAFPGTEMTGAKGTYNARLRSNSSTCGCTRNGEMQGTIPR
jgi:hypothetical protein